jgi:hypothetical protein
MSTQPAQPYPGDLATANDVRLLAERYRDAAHLLQQMGRPKDPLSRAPYRLIAIHAIELYLNALLLHRGIDQGRIRGMQHDLALRSQIATSNGLHLRSRTIAHLGALAEQREYLVSRYGPQLAGAASQINRLAATLEEIATKVTLLIEAHRQVVALSGPTPAHAVAGRPILSRSRRGGSKAVPRCKAAGGQPERSKVR